MEFTKNNFEAFRKDVEDALAGVAAKHQINITTGKIKYTSLDFTMELKVDKAGDVNAERERFRKFCPAYGFSVEDYLIQFTVRGDTFELVGFKTGSPKNNTLFRKVGTDRTYHGNNLDVQRWLGRTLRIPVID